MPDQFGVPEEEEEGEPSGYATRGWYAKRALPPEEVGGGLPTTVEELLQMLLAILPKDQWGNLITIRGPISAQGLAQSLLSPQGRLWFTKLKSEVGMTPAGPILEEILAGDLSKLPFKIPRMRTSYETAVGEYEGRISDKGFVDKFLASAGVESIYDLPDYQQRILANAIRQQAESEGIYAQARPSWGAYGGYAQYEGPQGYAAQRQEQERLMREQGADVDMYVAPKTAFGQVMPTSATAQSMMEEFGMTGRLRQAQELGIDVSQYMPNVNQPRENLEYNILYSNLALSREISRKQEELALTKSKRLGADYPEFAGRYQAHMAPTTQEVYRPEPLAGMASWLETLPEFKEARQKREAEMIGKYPAAWQAYGAYEGPMGWQEWTAQEPAAQEYIKAQELKFTQARQRARAQIAPKARWATYA